MESKQLNKHGTENHFFKFNKADAIAGYAFVGAWLSLILGYTGLVGSEYSSQVSLGLAALGGVIGAILVNRKK